MAPPNPDLESLVERIANLEKKNRRTMRGGMILLVLASAGLLMCTLCPIA